MQPPSEKGVIFTCLSTLNRCTLELIGPPALAVDAAWSGRIHIYTLEYLFTYLQ